MVRGSCTIARYSKKGRGGCGRRRASLIKGIAIGDATHTLACDSLAEWSKALASGASPQGRGFEPHSCHLFLHGEYQLASHKLERRWTSDIISQCHVTNVDITSITWSFIPEGNKRGESPNLFDGCVSCVVCCAMCRATGANSAPRPFGCGC